MIENFDLAHEPKRPIVGAAKYTSYAGVDTRVRIDGKTYGQIQAISYQRLKLDNEWQVAGTIIVLVLDEGCGNLPEKFGELEVLAANEFGSSAIAFGLKDVEIITSSSGMSIDDMVVEEQYTYIAKEFVPGRRLTVADWPKARCLPVHTKHVPNTDDEKTRALVKEAVALTAEEPTDFLTDLAKLLDRHHLALL